MWGGGEWVREERKRESLCFEPTSVGSSSLDVQQAAPAAGARSRLPFAGRERNLRVKIKERAGSEPQARQGRPAAHSGCSLLHV